MRILVTGGAGFIGSAVCRHLVADPQHSVINLDKLTYAGNLNSLRSIEDRSNYKHLKVDICDEEQVLHIMQDEQVDAVLHLAAETHVDRSIDAPGQFVQTNIVGTYRMLSAARAHWQLLEHQKKDRFRFHHVSTDEVFGELSYGDGGYFTEDTPYAPSSPYSASKAASDHLARAWCQTYSLPVVLSNCSNNYGPFQFPEKLIPLVILNALQEQPLPVYGRGENVRDWLYVEDHARALATVLMRGAVGESYNIGSNEEHTNLQVVEAICDVLDARRPRANGESHRSLITFVPDRPGHDRRYAIDANKVKRELGWEPVESFETGLEKTIDWFLDNAWWWQPIRARTYRGERLGNPAGSAP
ncbi:MAG: dTDP-glucose 4,6-dehydratase [Alphaproteobacteria bacterium]|nr:dTDP-glucose 4,6-dehydratase [Alphaproteobacteria bacterium]